MTGGRPSLSEGWRRRALVTGGAGFIGSHVAEALCEQGWDVEVLDNLSTGDPSNLPECVRLHAGDIRSDGDVRDAFAGPRFDAVVHCAAQTSVERSMLDPAADRDVNVAGTRRLAAAARAAGVPRFVFLSTGGAIYGETSSPADERTLPSPRSYYGLHKFAAEQLLATEGISLAVLRPSNVYGMRQRADAEGGVVAIFAGKLEAGEPLEIHGDGLQTRDFVHVSDVVSAVLVALGTPDDVVWNVASGQATTILGLAGTMAQLCGRQADIRFRPRRAGDVAQSLLVPATLLATGAWGPPLFLADGLRLTLPSPLTAPAEPARPAVVA